MKNMRFILIGIFTSLLFGCGVEVHSDESHSSYEDLPDRNAYYTLHLMDEEGYMIETLASGCIDLDDDDSEDIEIEEYSHGDYTYLNYNWEVDGRYLIVQLDHDGHRLYRSFYRTTYFSQGHEIQEDIVSESGSRYTLTMTGQGCR